MKINESPTLSRYSICLAFLLYDDQNIYGLFGLKHHTMEGSGDATIDKQTRMPMDAGD